MKKNYTNFDENILGINRQMNSSTTTFAALPTAPVIEVSTHIP